jgi:hypothetical protein
MVRDHHPACDPAGQLLQRLAEGFCEAVGADRQDRTVRGGLQQDQGPVQLDCHSGLNPGEATATLLANLRLLPRQALNKFWPAEKDNQHDARSNEVQYSDDHWS